MRDQVVLQPGEARVFRLPKGSLLGLRDLEGHQAVELIAFDESDPSEYLDCSVTMEIIGRLFPTEKSKFYSNRYDPLFTLVEDTVGTHDLLQPATSALSRSLFLGEDGTRTGTREACEKALAADGLGALSTTMPRPVHFFRRTDVDVDGNFVLMETPSKPGSGVVLSVERSMIVVVAVPDDEISPITGCNPTPIQVEITGVV